MFRQCLLQLKTEHDGVQLSESALGQLQHLVPTESEALLVSRFRGDRSKFRPVEAFMAALADIPDRPARVAAINFRATFEAGMGMAEEPVRGCGCARGGRACVVRAGRPGVVAVGCV